MTGDMETQARALKLEAGCIYAIELSQPLAANQMVELRDALQENAKHLGLSFVLLGPNLKIARDDRKVVPA